MRPRLPGYPVGHGKKDADALREEIDPELDDLQEQLYASGATRQQNAPSLLIVLQGLDTAGKVGHPPCHRHGRPPWREDSLLQGTDRGRARARLLVDPHALPGPGQIGIFDRLHYEDVLIQRVESFAPPEEIERRYGGHQRVPNRNWSPTAPRSSSATSTSAAGEARPPVGAAGRPGEAVQVQPR